MSDLPNCPQCGSAYTYEDGTLYICPECAHEWPREAEAIAGEGGLIVKDAHGNLLSDGDSITVIKDLKVKGSSSVVKVGTKVKNVITSYSIHYTKLYENWAYAFLTNSDLSCIAPIPSILQSML